MVNDGDINATSTTYVYLDGGKKNRKEKKHKKGNEEMLLDLTPSEALTSYPPSTTEASYHDRGYDPFDITHGDE